MKDTRYHLFLAATCCLPALDEDARRRQQDIIRKAALERAKDSEVKLKPRLAKARKS